MTALATSLNQLYRHVVISTRSNIHELFDANKYGKLLPLPEFTLEFKDPTGELEFLFHGGNDFWTTRTEEKLQGEILSCEPLEREPRSGPVTTLPRYWRIKIRFLVKFSERDERAFHSFSEYVETFIDYDSVTKKAKLCDDRFYRKFMRWLEPGDENNPGGLFFNGRRIARVAEPKPQWEQSRNLPFDTLQISVPAYNAFGRQFQYGTVGDVAEFLDSHTDEEVCRFPSIGVAKLSEMKEALRQLGWQRMK
jgi:hypothetical protein